MTTVNNANVCQQTNGNNSYNPYIAMNQTTMSNDFFGSQAFGNNINSYGTATAKPSELGEGSGTLASSILQQYYATQNGTGYGTYGLANGCGISAQDYYMANQIANMYTGNIPLLSNTTNFTNNDVFAKQVFGVPNNTNFNYSA